MNILSFAALTFSHAGGVSGLLIGFLLILIALAVIAGLIWFIETYINKALLPALVRRSLTSA